MEGVPFQRQQALPRGQPLVHQRTVGDDVRARRPCPRPRRRRRCPLARRAGDAGHRRGVQQLEQVRGDLLVAAQVDRQAVEPGQVAEAARAHHAQAQAQRPGDLHLGRQMALEARQVGRRAGQPGLDDLDRPQRDVLAGAEFTRRFLARGHLGMKRRVARHLDAAREVAFRDTGVQLRHGHRGRGAEVVGVEHFEQALREARKLRVQLDLHARRQEAEGLDQALHIRVVDLGAVQPQAARDLRVRGGEFAGGLAHVDQLFVVVVEKVGVHGGLSFGAVSVRVRWGSVQLSGLSARRAPGRARR